MITMTIMTTIMITIMITIAQPSPAQPTIIPQTVLALGVLTCVGRVLAGFPGLAVAACWAGDASRCSFLKKTNKQALCEIFFTVFVEPISLDTLLRRNS